MPRWLHVTLQAILVGLNIFLTYRGAPVGVTAGLAALQGALATVAQAYNVDGSPQILPFPPGKGGK